MPTESNHSLNNTLFKQLSFFSIINFLSTSHASCYVYSILTQARPTQCLTFTSIWIASAVLAYVGLAQARPNNVQPPHTSARGRQFLMLYSARKRLSALCASCRLRVAAESAEQREVAANERTSRDRLAAESPQLDKLRERPGYSR